MLRKLTSQADKINCFRGLFPKFFSHGNYFWTLLPLLSAQDFIYIWFTKALINKPVLSVLILFWTKNNMAAFPEFYPLFVCPDATNIASLMDHLVVSYRPCCQLNGPSYGWIDHSECSPAFQWRHLLWKYIPFPIKDTTSYAFIISFFVRLCS